MSLNLNDLSDLEALARRCTQHIGAVLEPGMSEQDAASLMREWFKQQGVNDQMHRPLAWFGRRTALSGRSSWLPRPGVRPDYYPSSRSLRDGDAVALYCAPRLNGLCAEAIRCMSHGANPAYQRLTHQLADFQHRLAEAIDSGQTIAQLEALMHGLASRQQLHLRHRRPPVLDWLRPYDGQPDTGYADTRLVDRLASITGNPLPAHLPTSGVPIARNQPLAEGVWVIQPWLSDNQYGAGLRSLLKVEHRSVCWLNPTLGTDQDKLPQSA